MNDCRDIFAVIVSWNGAQWLPKALGSLADSTYPVQPVVVDNASTDPTIDVLRHFPDTHVISLSSNHGFGKANNQGIGYALSQGADYILLLNQDAWVNPDTIELLVNVAEEHPDFGILSPLHLDYVGAGIDPMLLHQLKKRDELISDALMGRLSTLYELPFINAAIWLLPRIMVEQVGGFDSLYFMYGEDNDYCERAKWHGFRIGLVPAARAFHWHTWRRRQMTFSSRVSDAYIAVLKHLKRPSRPFAQNLLIAAASTLRRVGIGLVKLRPQEILAAMCATVRGWLKLRVIHWHYRLSMERGPFLTVDRTRHCSVNKNDGDDTIS